MTIRFTCNECESVLNIRDELAGTKAKCPKCKTAFVVPGPQAKATQKAPASVAASTESLEDLIDMPLEVTPAVQYDSDDGFDPLDVLSSGAQPLTSNSSAGLVEEAPKPTVAELMREHEANMASKKKKRERKNKAGGLEEAAAAASLMTAGTASDALTRTYDQKRGKASEPAALTREERRQLEQREAMKQFAIRGGAALAGILICTYFLISWAFSKALPPLAYVSGVVTLNSGPLAGVEVTFAPTKNPGELDLENATPSTGFTNTNGEFTLMYDPENEGVLPGLHNVSIISPAGVKYILPPADQQQTLEIGEDKTINFNL